VEQVVFAVVLMDAGTFGMVNDVVLPQLKRAAFISIKAPSTIVVGPDIMAD
jgi:hypothetical protein